MSAAIARALATVGGLGDRLPAPGTTVGSVAGALLFWVATRFVPLPLWLTSAAGLALLAPLAVWACGTEAARRGEADPGAAALDEVAGQWLALAVVALVGRRVPGLGGFVAAFVLFRAFDIAKPWPIRRLERLPGGWGIVADDLAAGAAAGVLQVALARLL